MTGIITRASGGFGELALPLLADNAALIAQLLFELFLEILHLLLHLLAQIGCLDRNPNGRRGFRQGRHCVAAALLSWQV